MVRNDSIYVLHLHFTARPLVMWIRSVAILTLHSRIRRSISYDQGVWCKWATSFSVGTNMDGEITEHAISPDDCTWTACLFHSRKVDWDFVLEFISEGSLFRNLGFHWNRMGRNERSTFAIVFGNLVCWSKRSVHGLVNVLIIIIITIMYPSVWLLGKLVK